MSGESFTFGGKKLEEQKKPTKQPISKEQTPKQPRPRKPKIDPQKLVQMVNEFQMVTGSIHVNFSKPQKDMLKNIVGSYKVADVRKWLNDRYADALGAKTT